MLKIVLASLSFLLLTVTIPKAHAAAFVEAACTVPSAQAGLVCGTVSVPRDYAAPGGPQFRLAVVIVRAPSPLPDPVVYISGGPGAPLTRYAGEQARTPYVPHRDLILVDQRGTGQSEPKLCPGLRAQMLDAQVILAANPDPATMAARRAVFMACRADAVAHGIDLRDFGTTITAADYEQVRQALGVTRWNVYGNSYGTTVAMTLAALHPATLRSLVLDSIYPPEPAPPWSSIVATARDAFFATCAADPACRTAYPDLAGIYQDALERLRQAPSELTASLFEVLVANLVYYPPAYPTLPRLIAAVRDGHTQGATAALRSVLAGAQVADIALHAAVECRDRAHYHQAAPTMDVLDLAQLYGVCDGWEQPGPLPRVPSGTAVPALVLAGQFDPVSGPALSRATAGRIGARWVEFSGMGHHVRAFSLCAARIVAAFIDDPEAAPQESCAGDEAPIRFLPPSVR